MRKMVKVFWDWVFSKTTVDAAKSKSRKGRKKKNVK